MLLSLPSALSFWRDIFLLFFWDLADNPFLHAGGVMGKGRERSILGGMGEGQKEWEGWSASLFGTHFHLSLPCWDLRFLSIMTKYVWKWHPTPVFLTGEPHGQKSLLGSPWGHKESDTIEHTHIHYMEKETATHSSILAWRIPRMEEPSGLLSRGLHRVGYKWSNLAAAAYIMYA